jgi:hypothetical protein
MATATVDAGIPFKEFLEKTPSGTTLEVADICSAWDYDHSGTLRPI